MTLSHSGNYVHYLSFLTWEFMSMPLQAGVLVSLFVIAGMHSSCQIAGKSLAAISAGLKLLLSSCWYISLFSSSSTMLIYVSFPTTMVPLAPIQKGEVQMQKLIYVYAEHTLLRQHISSPSLSSILSLLSTLQIRSRAGSCICPLISAYAAHSIFLMISVVYC